MLTRFILLALLGTSFLAKADVLEWTIRSEYPFTSQIEFFAEGSNRAWPGGDRAYSLDDYAAHTYTLNCYPGEKICYGAWDKMRPTVYWGVRNHDTNCSKCCATCGEGSVAIRLTQ